jgi:ferrous iron transport protein A
MITTISKVKTMKKTLDQMKAGEHAKLIQFSENADLHFKLLSLGLLPGDEIKVISRAPFGGPISVGHGSGNGFAIRLKEAKCIEVETMPAHAKSFENQKEGHS